MNYRIKMIQAGTTHYIDGQLTLDEADERLDLEESLHRASGWKVGEDAEPGQLILSKGGIDRVIQIECAEEPVG